MSVEEVAVSRYWHEGITPIATIEIPMPGGNSAIVFGTDGVDEIRANLFHRLPRGGYFPHGGFTRSLTESNTYANWSVVLDGVSVYYGIADFQWWSDNISEAERVEYSVVEFQVETGEYVLWYRVCEGV
jgi:hypothetical protein